MSAIAIKPTATSGDRLGLTICLAIIVHTMVVMGISFTPEPIPESRFESLEVILVTRRSEKPPEDANMLAQSNLQGGGNSEQAERPSAPIEAPVPAPSPEIAATSAPAVEQTREQVPDPAATDERAPAQAQSAEAQAPSSAPERLVTEAPQADLEKPEPESRPQPDAPVAPVSPPKEQPRPKVATQPLPTAAQLITRSFAMASLDAELQQKLELRARRPRRKFISASTKEYRFAAYMEAWRAKVERVGNINYPDEARRKDLSGSLLLDVALNPDGSVREITVRRSSGKKVLDDAAVRIVELAAPFARFPDDFLKEIDILHVTRTWKFLNSDKFSSR
ncbi:MAG: protein TonB [Gammaproteobacteria bacterium]|jgi:protein TonB